MAGVEAGALVRQLGHYRSSRKGSGAAGKIKGTDDTKVNTEQGTIPGVQT